MDQRTGELFTEEELNAKFNSMTDEQKAEFEKALQKLTKPEYDKYSKFPEAERPVAMAFDKYLAGKRRYNEPRTQRQAFYAGFYAHQALTKASEGPSEASGLEAQLEAMKDKAEKLEKVQADGLEKSEGAV